MNLYLLLLFCLKVTVIICTPKCEDFTTCGACVLNTYDSCQWCAAENHKEKRCRSTALEDETWCRNPIKKPAITVDVTKDVNWSNGDNGSEIIQFRPQAVKIISASPGESVNISMYYKPAKDAPLDIYFLIDNSKDIEEALRILKNQSTLLLKSIEKYTNNVRLGVGSFVEKPVLPYGNPDIQQVYTFKNDLPLTKDLDKFNQLLQNFTTGSNYDAPENLLGGLMQAMLCKNQIDWGKDSRQIIFVFTNAFYHMAGDGKMIGAFKRYDFSKCHEDTLSDTTMDYPSVAQVNKVAKKNGYVIIFGYEGDVSEEYRLLSEKINGAHYVKMDYRNVANIIRNEYIEVIENIEVTSESSSNLQVSIVNKCPDCKAMHFSAPLEIVATIKVVSCPSPSIDKEIIKLIPTSLNGELEVEIHFNCQCECEKNDFTEKNSSKCSREGDYQCGICKCNPQRSGDDCKCKSDSVNMQNDYKKCKKDIQDNLLCSGHGDCSCGKCQQCHKGFSGQFCEYDDNACPRPAGKLCSGHGNCTLGKCQCFGQWVHSLDGIEDCGCTIDQKSCIAPYSNKVCSGNGNCECGRCICSIKANSNDTCAGRYCDKCSWFAEKRCEELKEYAYCKFLDQTGCQEKYNLMDTIVLFANRTEINSPNNTEWYMANWCRVNIGEDESIFVFKYYYSSDEFDTGAETEPSRLILVLQKELDKKPPADIWVAVGSAIGGILLIGLLSILLWKVITHIYDEREYNQFVEKARAAGFDVNMTENPWYEPPMTTFINPAHVPATSCQKNK